MRRAPALLVAAALVMVSLSACSTNPNANCSAAVGAGHASNLISVKGDFGHTPAVSFPTPLKAGTTQSTTTIKGTGVALEKHQIALLDYWLFDGTTGKKVTSSDTPKGLPISVGETKIPGLDDALLCSTVGSRLAIAMSSADTVALGGQPQGSAIMVVDIVGSYLPRANGADQPHTPGFPMVVLAPNGTPGISQTSGTPPADLKIAVLKAGSGQTVKRTDTVIVNYTGVVWGQTTTFANTWAKGQPDAVQPAAGLSQSGGVPSGFASAIVGQKVGSQVIAIVPPAKGYGKTGTQTGVPANATLIYVIDILGIQ